MTMIARGAARARLVRSMAHTSPPAFGCAAAACLGQATCTVLSIVAIGRLAGALASGADPRPALVVVLAVMASAPALGAAHELSAARLQERCVQVAHGQLVSAVLAPHGIRQLESPGVAGEAEALAEMLRDQYFRGIEAFWYVLAMRLSGAAAVVLLARWSVPLTAVAVAAQLAVARTWSRYLAGVWDGMAGTHPDLRRSRYFQRLLLTTKHAPEIHVFGLQSFALRHMSRRWHVAMNDLWAARARQQRPVLIAGSCLIAGQGLLIAVLGRQLWNGTASVAVAITIAQAVVQTDALGALGDVQTMVERQIVLQDRMKRLAERLREGASRAAPAITSSELTATRPRRSPRGASISLTGVTFSYSHDAPPVLQGIDLDIDAGTALAVVGVNGAGKSTLIKLLCGLYVPTAGTVTVDGGDPARDESARLRLTAIFQEFVHYDLSLLDNIDPSGADTGPTAARIAAAKRALDAAGGDEVLSAARDWATPLSPSFGGVGLSGGQWQRVALARALARVEAGAGVVILDEPTAALDVRTEAEIFRQFDTATRDATTILVSHRLSTVRRADRIIVLDGGRVAEDGHHDDLMRAGGLYADMFRLQALKYATVPA